MLPNKSAIDGIPLSSESESFKAKLEQQAARFKEEANAIKKTSKKQKASFTEVIASNAEAISKSKDSAMATLGKAKTRDSSCPPRKETACQKSERAKGDKKDV